MSKIICEVCGTSYPETSSQCPICGYIHSGDAKAVNNDTDASVKGSSGYNHVKGGHFSKKNVRKRTQKSGQTKSRSSAANAVRKNEKEDKTTVGLVIVAVLLLLAIIAVVLYISVQVFGPGFLPKPNGTKDTTPVQTTDTKPVQSQQTPGTSEDTTPDDTTTLPECESITLDVSEVSFDKAGAARMLYVSLLPENTALTVSFTSDNEAVATVTEDGKVTAVAPGQAVITATCGDVSAQCTVVCAWEVETTEPEETTTETVPETTAGEEEFRLNRKDITFSSKGESWVLYNGSIGKTLITWSSEDEAVATIEGGKVVAVGAGTTNVYGEYEGTKVSCIIRCSFKSDSENQGVGGNGGGVSEDGGGASGGNTGTAEGGYKLYNPYGNAEDVSIRVGDSFSLQLVDMAGNYVSATWSVDDPDCCSNSDNKFTGESAGTTKITATYDGQSFVCIVRVRS